jgi:hypothetical protein
MRLSRVDHRPPPRLCPWCGELLDTAAGIDADQAPVVGDISVCIKCGGVCLFGPGLALECCPDTLWQNEHAPLPAQIREARRAVWLTNALLTEGLHIRRRRRT